MIALAWFAAFLALASTLVAIIAALGAGKSPRPTPLECGHITWPSWCSACHPPTDDHMRVAVENTSAQPIYDQLAIEVFRRQLDERLEEGLRDWGKGGVA